MNSRNSKKILTLAVVFLLLTSIASALIISSTSAHTPPWQIKTYAYINVAPNPIGVGQPALVLMWLDKVFAPTITQNDNFRFHNYQLIITGPDGKSQSTTFSYVADSTSAQPYTFTPTSAGIYTLNFTFPGQDFNQYDHPTTGKSAPLVNDTYLPSSASTTLVVQEQPITYPSVNPLPTSYWSRPIYGENPYWYIVSSNWLGEGAPVQASVGSGDVNAYSANSPIWLTAAGLNRFPGDAVGPLTSHIMWTKPLQSGGVVGGNDYAIPGDTFYGARVKFTNPIIMNGMLYYQAPLNVYSEGSSAITSGTYCINLKTGEQLWETDKIPSGQLSFGMIYDFQGSGDKGVIPPLLIASNAVARNYYSPSGFWSTTDTSLWQAFDAQTGLWMFNLTNVPGTSLPETMGPNGEHIRYVPTYGKDGNLHLAQWNSSNLFGHGAAPTISSLFGQIDASNPIMYDWNITLPSTVPANFQEIAAFSGNMILCESGTMPILSTGESFSLTSSSAPYTYFAINLNATRGTVGSMMWKTQLDAPPGNITVLLGPSDPSTGVFTEAYMETQQWVGYSLYTGQKLWGPTVGQAALDYFGNPITPDIQGQLAYGNLYSSGYSGILYCYDLKTGNLEWTYGNGAAGNSTRAANTPYGGFPTFINAVGNGVIYTVTSEHTTGTPIYKGALARAINATDGTEIWTLSAYTGEFNDMSYAIADGYATFLNGYDNQIYSVGKGPSSTTVSTPHIGLQFGTPIVITGTVFDISSGTKQEQQAANFPNGVPVASDVSMKDWMGYIYQQQTFPSNFTGVPVTIQVLDSNGNTRTIGITSTDASGNYKLTWTPDIPGNYTVFASFAGTNSYWSSSAEDSFTVMNTPTATATPAHAAPSMVDTYFLPSVIAIIIAIAVSAVIILLQLRKP